jgi:hypothetical protein
LQFFQTQPAQTGFISHYDQDQGAVDGQVNIAGSQFVETGTVQMQDYPVVEGERPATAYLSSGRRQKRMKLQFTFSLLTNDKDVSSTGNNEVSRGGSTMALLLNYSPLLPAPR